MHDSIPSIDRLIPTPISHLYKSGVRGSLAWLSGIQGLIHPYKVIEVQIACRETLAPIQASNVVAGESSLVGANDYANPHLEGGQKHE
jgi:hypothetical protein